MLLPKEAINIPFLGLSTGSPEGNATDTTAGSNTIAAVKHTNANSFDFNTYTPFYVSDQHGRVHTIRMRAFTHAAHRPEPPLGPRIVIEDMPDPASSALLSAAPTKPTGIPQTKSTAAPCFTNSNRRNRAVGAFPKAKIRTPSSTALSTDAMARVTCNRSDAALTESS
jgi:hypothetical protein